MRGHLGLMTIADTVSLVRRAFSDEAFTAADAQAHGIGPDRLERSVHAGALRRLGKGVYALADSQRADTWGLVACRARRLGNRGVRAVIAGSSTADFWNVPVVGAPPDAVALKPTLYVDPESGVREGARDGVRILHGRLAVEDVWEGSVHLEGTAATNGLLLCMPLRTGVDVTRHLRLSKPAAVAALSAAQRRHAALLGGLTSVIGRGADRGGLAREDWRDGARLTRRLEDAALRDSLRAAMLDAILRAPHRGLRHVREALPYVDPRLETALESISWAFMCMSGLPLPRPQAWVTGASGRRYRVDFFWPEFGLVGEADGAIKYRAVADVMAEKERHSDLVDGGLSLVRWTWRDAWSQTFIARLERSMSRLERSI